MTRCNTCAHLFDSELLRDAEKLRLKLNREETKLIDYMRRMVAWMEAEQSAKFLNHDCDESQLRVLGPAKAKKVKIAKSKGKSKAKNASTKQKVKRLVSKPSKNSKTPKKMPTQVEEASQSITTTEGERIDIL